MINYNLQYVNIKVSHNYDNMYINKFSIYTLPQRMIETKYKLHSSNKLINSLK